MYFRLILTALTLSLGGCGSEPSPADAGLAALDAELTGAEAANAVDPQLMAALNDPIMIDPLLAAKSNGDALRPPSLPYAAPVPHPAIAAGSAATDEKLLSAPAPTPLANTAARQAVTLGALARTVTDKRGGCAATLAYSASWATRLPAAIPLHPDARVIEAAGTDRAGCAMRGVSFFVAAPADRLIDWYYTRARQSGYSTGHQADGAVHLLAGARGRRAYALFITDRGDGATDVDLITTD